MESRGCQVQRRKRQVNQLRGIEWTRHRVDKASEPAGSSGRGLEKVKGKKKGKVAEKNGKVAGGGEKETSTLGNARTSIMRKAKANTFMVQDGFDDENEGELDEYVDED